MSAYLLEPFVAQIMGCLFGIDLVPGLITILGVVLLTMALVMINKGT
jgi:hypothetical protein